MPITTKSTDKDSDSNVRYRLPFDEYDYEELDLSGDLWRPCPSYPGYEAAYSGLIRVWRKFGETSYPYILISKKVQVTRDGVSRKISRALLIADAFLIPPQEGWAIRYINGDNTDFSMPNLMWEPRQNRVARANAMGKHFGRNKSHCVHGHPLSGDSVRITSGGSRMCLVCARAHTSMYQEKQTLKKHGLPFDHVTLEYVLKRRGDWVAPENRT